MHPIHINVTTADLTGNQGAGRYLLLPGSSGRAEQIATHFDNVTVRSHPRGHDCYLGQLYTKAGLPVDVGVVASGMGCPSMEIILHELYSLGARRFLRVGTAGSMQSDYVQLGDLVNATASVRDESTTHDYAPVEFPAVASSEMVSMIRLAAEKTGLNSRVHEGIVHCKASFYARQFGAGYLSPENMRYKEVLTGCGVLASEMETATLFIQSAIYQQAARRSHQGPLSAVMAGAILGIVSAPPATFMTSDQQTETIESSITLALETLRVLAEHECQPAGLLQPSGKTVFRALI